MIDLDQVSKNVPTLNIEVPEWNGKITIRRMKLTEYAELADGIQGADEVSKISAQVPLILDMLVKTIIVPKASPEQLRACLDQLSLETLLEVGNQAIEFSNAKKNNSPTGGSTVPLPSAES